MGSTASISIVDFDGQVGIMGMNTVPLTAGNFAAQAGLLDTLLDTLPAIIDGVAIATSQTVKIQLTAPGFQGGNPDAQRGNKWIVKGHDTLVNLGAGVPNPSYLKPFEVEIPTADVGLRINHEDVVWVEGGANNVAAFDPFVAAFEAFATSPNGGLLAVDKIEAVTRTGG